jgi:hypothetical protein
MKMAKFDDTGKNAIGLSGVFCSSLFVGIMQIVFSSSIAGPCFPNDPTGNNPQNPCLPYPPPGIRSDSFVEGNARPVTEFPTIQNPSGRVLASPSGYWAGSSTSEGVRTVKTNDGRVFRFQSD